MFAQCEFGTWLDSSIVIVTIVIVIVITVAIVHLKRYGM
jgi:hypothetical protein